MTDERKALGAIERAQRREMRAMLGQASAASERAESLDQLAKAFAAANMVSQFAGPAGFLHRARLARREAAIARSQSRVHTREAARAEAEIEALQSKVAAVWPEPPARGRTTRNKR